MEEERPPSSSSSSSSSYRVFLKVMSKRRTWVCIFVGVYAAIVASSWNVVKSIVTWHSLQRSEASAWPALYASVVLGVVFGVASMVAALAVVVPATLVTWISIVVLLAFFGKPRSELVVEGRTITREIVGCVLKILLKEGNIVAALCALLGYFTLFRRSSSDPIQS